MIDLWTGRTGGEEQTKITIELKMIVQHDLPAYLREIQTMLNEEAPRWDRTNNSKTAEQIATYQGALNLLLRFLEQGDTQSFIQTFPNQGISVDGIGDCFRGEGSTSLEKKQTAVRKLRFVCNHVLLMI